jgi:zinc/manganese transport system permease protein
MLSQVPWWLYPLFMCLVLTGIHGYLGIHVLKRKVIFVDLAMAQIAALGAAYAILLGYDPKHPENSFPIYLFSLGFTLAGAAVISLSRMKRERVPHEAFIGIVYASASALAILLLSKSPTEGEQIKHMLVGSLLTVQGPKVWTTAAIYAVIGLFHWVYRAKFFAISDDPDAAEKAGISVRLWDFLFYVSFGFVITSSVSVAGVLLVFSYLVVPGVIAVMFSESNRSRILVAWTVGTVVSLMGMTFSYHGDFPPGPSIVAAFTACLILSGLVHYVTAAEQSGAAVKRLAAGMAVAALAIWGTTFLRKQEKHEHGPEDIVTKLTEALKSDNDTQVLQALDHIKDLREQDRHFVGPVIEVVKRTKSDQVLDHAAEALAKLDDPAAIPILKEAATRDLDAELLVHLGRALLDLRDPGGFAVLIRVLDSGPPEFARKEAVDLFQERTGLKLDDAGLRKWWSERGPTVKWKGASKRFE